jgi:hypothetical protein
MASASGDEVELRYRLSAHDARFAQRRIFAPVLYPLSRADGLTSPAPPAVFSCAEIPIRRMMLELVADERGHGRGEDRPQPLPAT